MTDPLERVLELVASGRLTAEEAAPILDALEAKSRPVAGAGSATNTTAGEADGEPAPKARYARVEVRESGRRVVDLRVPISLGRFALSRVPGLSSQQIADNSCGNGWRNRRFGLPPANQSGICREFDNCCINRL